jgi:hypothetical protein
MQEQSPLDDPLLEALARRLALVPPRVDAADRDALLYDCGFAAGRESALRVARRWRAAAASMALVAVSLGVISTISRPAARVAEVAGVAEPGRKASSDIGPIEDERLPSIPRRGGLVASSSWEQIRASFDSAPRTKEVFVAPPASPPRAVLSVGAAWNIAELSQ